MRQTQVLDLRILMNEHLEMKIPFKEMYTSVYMCNLVVHVVINAKLNIIDWWIYGLTFGFLITFFQWKNRVRSQQIEREKEQTDHAVMLRELQKLLANERLAKEQVEHQVIYLLAWKRVFSIYYFLLKLWPPYLII